VSPDDEQSDGDRSGIEEQLRREQAVMEAFSPTAPVARRDLFAGRARELMKVMRSFPAAASTP
jgi:hypothetical protein